MIGRKYEVVRRRGGSSGGVNDKAEELGRLESGVLKLCEKIDDSISNYTSGVLSDFIRAWDSRFKKIGVLLNTSLNLSGEVTSSYISKINNIIRDSYNDSFLDLVFYVEHLHAVTVIDDLSDDSNFDDVNKCFKKLGEVFSCCAAEINNLSRIIDKLLEIISTGTEDDIYRITPDFDRIKHNIISWLRDIDSNIITFGKYIEDHSISDLRFFIEEHGDYFNIILSMPTEGFDNVELTSNKYYSSYIKGDKLVVKIKVEN